MSKVVIYGTGVVGELAHFYLTRDSGHEVVAFAADKEYISAPEFAGLPVYDIEEVPARFPPDAYKMFVAFGYRDLNKIRRLKYEAAKRMGYELISYVSSKATVWTEQIGENCFILEDNTLQPFVKIGNNVILWSGNHIGHHTVIHDHCFLASHIVVSGGVEIGENCFLGVNATLRDHIKIGQNTIIGAGAIILGNVPEGGVYKATATPLFDVPSERVKNI